MKRDEKEGNQTKGGGMLGKIGQRSTEKHKATERKKEKKENFQLFITLAVHFLTA